MHLSLDVLRARKGDCLMLHYGSDAKPGLMLIDGGPSGVFAPQLERRIGQIRKARELADEKSLPVDVLMVSHVDDDHIKGILELTRLLRQQKEAHDPLLVRVKSLWHNSFDDMVDTTPEELEAHAQFGAASIGGAGELPLGEDFDAAMVLASIPQGRTLRLDAKLLKWESNRELREKLVLANEDADPIELGNLELTVVGPLRDDLVKLQEAHDKWLKAQEKKRKEDPQAALAAFSDRSIPNLSSLVVLVKAGGRSILLTGDARGDKVLKGLALTGVIGKGSKSGIHLDVLKVPHHGSANNVTKGFFQRLTADHYVLSGNGEHGNPERETLEMILAARGSDDFELHFTYPIDEIDVEREKDWKKQQAKEKKKRDKELAKNGTSRTKVRANWSAKKNSLRELLDQQLAPGQEVRIVPKSKPHVIDLLDPLGA